MTRSGPTPGRQRGRLRAAVHLARVLARGVGFALKPPADLTYEGGNEAALGDGLPAGFLFGAATSAHQTEGGLDNDWTAFEAGEGHIADGSRSGRACDSWERLDDDLARLRELGANAYRFSIEWSRVEPQPGRFDDEALERYARFARQLREASIEPMVTLHHFTLPRWLAERGGWMADDATALFERYCGRAAARLGASVDLWCTVNEPNVLAFQGYAEGLWPPGVRDRAQTARVMVRLLEAHARAARAIRSNDTVDADGDGAATRIGLAHHLRVIVPDRRNLLDGVMASIADDFMNGAILDAHRTGRMRLAVPGSVLLDEEVPGLAGSFDWLGVNYYTRDHLRADLRSATLSELRVPDGAPINDLGWELHPEGLLEILRRGARLGMPIFVTENGMDDRSGERRADFLSAHVAAVEQAVAEGIRVEGYFHWSLLDNFEWAEGFEPRFGLFRVDFDDPRRPRTATPAVARFREISLRLRRSV